MVSNVKNPFRPVASQGQALSVSGKLYAFLKVGPYAKQSANMLKRIARSPILVKYHRRSASKESAPHIKSKIPIFQYAFLFANVPSSIKIGNTPTLNGIRDCIPTPCL